MANEIHIEAISSAMSVASTSETQQLVTVQTPNEEHQQLILVNFAHGTYTVFSPPFIGNGSGVFQNGISFYGKEA